MPFFEKVSKFEHKINRLISLRVQMRRKTSRAFRKWIATKNFVWNLVAARHAAGPQVEAERVARLRPSMSGRQATAEVSR